jgi:hypothetical protein
MAVLLAARLLAVWLQPVNRTEFGLSAYVVSLLAGSIVMAALLLRVGTHCNAAPVQST